MARTLTQAEADAVDRLRVEHPKWGGRRIAKFFDLPYGKVRGHMERNPEPTWRPTGFHPDLKSDLLDATWEENAQAVKKERIEDYLEHVSPHISFPAYRAYVYDLETTGLDTQIGMLRVASFLDINTGVMMTRTILDFDGPDIWDRERQLVQWAAARYHEADLLIGHNILGFDKGFLTGRSVAQGGEMMPKKTIADTMLIARYGLKGRLQGNSLANVADFFGVGYKDKPSKREWQGAISLDPDSIARIRVRCEADVYLNLAVFIKLKPFWHYWKGQ